MRYKGKAIGVLRVYTSEERHFSPFHTDLLKAVAAQAAAAIENARLLAETIEAEALEKQVQLAAEVQLRMIPQTPPKIQGVDLAAFDLEVDSLENGLAFDLGDKKQCRAALDTIGNALPIGHGISRSIGLHESDGGTAIDAIGKHLAKIGEDSTGISSG